MKVTTRLRFLVLPLATALGGSVAAQPGVPSVPFVGPVLSPETVVSRVPASAGAGTIHRLVPMDIDGDLARDHVLLLGDTPVLSYQPAIFQSYTRVTGVPAPVIDIDRLPAAGPNGADVLLALTDTDLFTVTFDGNSFVWAPVPATGWGGVDAMRTVRLGTTTLVLGRSASSATVICASHRDGNWVRGPDYVTSGGVIDMVGADWNADGELEIVVMTTSALEPFELRGAALPPVTSSGASRGLASLPGVTAGDGDSIAWVTELANVLTLSVVDATGIQATHTLEFALEEDSPPGTFDFLSITAGDVDLDGDADLHIGQTTAAMAIVLVNGDDGDSGPVFDPSTPGARRLIPLQPDPFTPLPGNVCAPVLDDLDGDLRADLTFARQDMLSVQMLAGVQLPPLPASSGGGYGLSADDILHAYSDFEPGTPAKLHLVMHTPQDYLTYFSHVQVAVWRQDAPGALLTPGGRLHAFYALDPTGTSPEHYLTIDRPTELFPTGTIWPDRDHFYVVWRWVNFQNGFGSDVSEASPSFACGITLRDTPTSMDYDLYLRGLPDARGTVDVSVGSGPGGGTSGGRTVVGSIVVQRVLPPAPSTQPPDAGAPESTERQTTIWDPGSYF